MAPHLEALGSPCQAKNSDILQMLERTERSVYKKLELHESVYEKLELPEAVYWKLELHENWR
jgi:hypothetical protein